MVTPLPATCRRGFRDQAGVDGPGAVGQAEIKVGALTAAEVY